jgi:hypothetical protein
MQRTIKWLLIVGVLIVWGLTDFASTLRTCQQEQQEKDQQGPEKGCGFADSLTARAIKETAEWIDTRHDFVTAAATIIIAFFTFTLWRATDRLWQAGERQLGHLDETAKRQLRAFVFGKGFQPALDLQNGVIKSYIVFAPFENVGLTPANDVRAWIAFKTVPINEEREITFATDAAIIPIPLGPRATAQTGIVFIPLPIMTAAWHNQIKIFIWCRIEYRDIFDDLHHHEQFAHVTVIHDPVDIPPKDHPSYVQFQFYGPQNTTG